MTPKFINPFTDFGFKKLFGEEATKDLLRDFLNQLLPAQHAIYDLTFKPSDNGSVGSLGYDRKAIFYVYAESVNGHNIIIELQKVKRNHGCVNLFSNRNVFYSTFPIREHIEQGDWNPELNAVYCVGILDFAFEQMRQMEDYVHHVQLRDFNGSVFYDKLNFIFVEIPKFTKQEFELESRSDQWLYFLKNLEFFDQIPFSLREQVFERAFQCVELSQFNRGQLDEYEQSLKTYRDWKGITDTAFFDGEAKGRTEGKMEGKIEGRLEERREIARRLRQMGINPDAIAQVTGLRAGEIGEV
jgi:predicted transposase/invertase (TIGR01784 family)